MSNYKLFSKTVSVLLYIFTTMYQTCSGLLDITAHHGENITLRCQSSSPSPIIAVEWTRRDLTSPVFFFMDGRSHKNQQDPSFVDRVDLLDREMKDGNLSLTLKDVSSNDTGTYECRVKLKNRGRGLNVIESPPINVIELTVIDSGHTAENTRSEGDKDRHVAWIVVLSVAGVFIAFVVAGFVIFRKRTTKQSQYQSPPGQEPQE